MSSGFAVGTVAATASAASFTVNDSTDAPLSTPSGTACVSTDAGGCTLRAAIQAADNTGGASTITLPAGDYTLTIPSTAAADPSTGDLDVGDGGNDVALTVVGAGAAATTIDANHVDRAFAVDAPGDSLSLSDVSITGGDAGGSARSSNTHSSGAGYGGAIYTNGALTVTDSTLNGNESHLDGGAIYADNGATSTSISGSTVSHDESTTSDAGAVEVNRGTMSISGSTLNYDSAPDGYAATLELNSTVTETITGSTIDHDSAYHSGAIGDYGAGPVSINMSDISNDSAQYYDGSGGAVQTNGVGAISLTSDTLDNDSSGYGGALDLLSSQPATLTGDTFANDSAVYDDGGAIYDENTAAVTIGADTFTGDSGDAGSAVYFDGTTEQVTNSTFDGNSGYYGAIYLDAAGAQFTNDTIAGNQGTEGGGIYGPAEATGIVNTIVAGNGGGDCYSGPAGVGADQGNNLDSDGSCFATGGVGTTPEVAGDLAGVNPDLGPLADNGGVTETDALLPGSPAIGAALGSACPPTDQRGVTHTGACDIGAYQTASADLGIAASQPATGTIGSPLSATLSVTNQGPGPATGVTVTDTLPAGSTYFNSSASQGTCTGTTTVTCTLGTVDSSASGPTNTATVTIVMVPGQAGSLTNTATVDADQTDPNSANNTASATTAVGAGPTVNGPTVTARVAPLVLSGVASQRTTTRATLGAIVNPAGESTSYSFQFGTSRTYGRTIAGGTLASTSAPQGVVTTVRSLKPGTIYHYRVVATNASGTTDGQDVSFKTAKAKPRKITLTATHHHGRVTIAGRVKLPAGVTRAAGCKGTVTIRETRGTRKVATRAVQVTHRCTYSGSIKLTGRATGKITATFAGNPSLIPRSSHTITVRG
jgi:uncharacterized repeat protein (TIGR01451 family)